MFGQMSMQDPFHLAASAGMFGLTLPMLTALFVVITLWALAWKAFALWHAARNRQKIWFVVLLFVHTAGLLEIAYLLWFKKDNNSSGSGALLPALNR